MSASRPPLTPSLLDRLIDACEGVAEPQPVNVDRLINDIEDLLNTCSVVPDPALAGYEEASQSILTYGSPAPQSLALATHKERLATARQMEAVLKRFEPRLASVRVRTEEAKSPSVESRFRLEATLPGELGRQFTLGVRVRTGAGRAQVTTERS